MEITLIIFTALAIIIPAIATVAWVGYIQEEDAEFMASIKITEEATVAVEPVVVTTVRRYKSEYIDALETEADVRMKQANSFYERGLMW